MSYSNIIFDVDGVLLDSMPYWKHLTRDYLRSIGVNCNDDIDEEIVDTSLVEGAKYLKDKFNLEISEEEIIQETLNRIHQQYQETIPLFPYVKEYIIQEANKGIKLYIATNSDQECIIEALQRTGIYHYFTDIISANDYHTSKRDPEFYAFMIAYWGLEAKDTLYYEDSKIAYENALKNNIQAILIDKNIFKEKIEMKKVLTIAGSDSSGGAGIQADLKTIAAHGVYGESAITALTAQNTTGVRSILESTPEFLADQLDACFEDIFPDAVKIGMVSNAELIHVIVEKLNQYKPEKIVVDPVMVATSGSSLMQNSAYKALVEELLPLATVITPNIPESEALTGMEIHNKADMENAAKYMIDHLNIKAVLVKGGHAIEDADDYLLNGTTGTWMLGKRIDNDNTHGTGCTLSSAIASNLALGYTLEESVKNAKDYLSGALADGLDLGKGSGPLNHMYVLKK